MADGYARATNGTKPTVITVQAGPGIENAFGGLAQAYADGIPILTIRAAPTSTASASRRTSTRSRSTSTSASGRARNFVDRIRS